MKHKLKLTNKEKIKIWLDLCDFSFNLMRKALGSHKLAGKLQRIRELHLKEDRNMLLALSRESR